MCILNPIPKSTVMLEKLANQCALNQVRHRLLLIDKLASVYGLLDP